MTEESDILLDEDDIKTVGTVFCKETEDGDHTVEINASNGNITLGGGNRDGDLKLMHSNGDETIRLNADWANATLGGHGEDGDVRLHDEKDDLTVHLNGEYGNITLGGNDQEGDVILKGNDGTNRIHLDGEAGPVSDTNRIYANGGTATFRVGGDNRDGTFTMYAGDDDKTVALDAGEGMVTLGGGDNLGVDGTVEIGEMTGDTRIRIGGYRTDDDPRATVDEPETRVRIDLDGSVELGGDGESGSISISDNQDEETVSVDGASGQIELGSMPEGSVEGRLLVNGETVEGATEIEGDYVGVGLETDEFRENRAIEIDGSEASVTVHDSAGDNERIEVSGDIATIFLSALADDGSGTYDSITIDGDDGEIVLSDGSSDTVVIDGKNGDIEVGSIRSVESKLQDLENRVSSLETN